MSPYRELHTSRMYLDMFGWWGIRRIYPLAGAQEPGQCFCVFLNKIAGNEREQTSSSLLLSRIRGSSGVGNSKSIKNQR